jgi:hypothetical protein
MVTFLGLDGRTLQACEVEVVIAVRGLARWLRGHPRPAAGA